MRHMKIKRVIALALLLTVAGISGFGRTGNSPSNSVKPSPTRYELIGHSIWLLGSLLEWPLTTMSNFVEESKFSPLPDAHPVLTKTGNYRFN